MQNLSRQVRGVLSRNAHRLRLNAGVYRTSARPCGVQLDRVRLCVVASDDTSTITKDFKLRSVTKDDVAIQFARSSGPGGQNVNKLNTKVDMRLSLSNATWIPDEVIEALERQEKKKINKDRELVVTSTKYRTQLQNIDDAMEKLQEMLERAVESVRPREMDPQMKKELEKRKKKANENRLKHKKAQSMKKADRRRKDW